MGIWGFGPGNEVFCKKEDLELSVQSIPSQSLSDIHKVHSDFYKDLTQFELLGC